ncbi:HEAT repeat domain-containing protein [Rhodococcus sp. NPDC003318]|uniref:HEAT repeat domain-containing protein n=1 Tax=Rhodococcus sp. NPDC003318 TaxID=3364503 RepID=UPI0036B68DC1
MNTTRHLNAALTDPRSSTRLRAALAAGTHDDPALVETLVARCAVEPDFFVRDMLTWALCRRPAQLTVPRLLDELGSVSPQARSQALHTLSKIGDRRAWPVVSTMLHDPDHEVARSAWRAAVALVPDDEKGALASTLVTALGRGDGDMQLSLSRALAALDEAASSPLDAARTHPDPRVRAHADATERLRADPDSGFAVEEAKRVAVAGPQA